MPWNFGGFDYGLVGGIGAGLQAGLQQYNQQQAIKRDQAQKSFLNNLASMQFQAGLAEKGLQLDPSTGQISMTPYAVANAQYGRKIENLKASNEILKNVPGLLNAGGSLDWVQDQLAKVQQLDQTPYQYPGMKQAAPSDMAQASTDQAEANPNGPSDTPQMPNAPAGPTPGLLGASQGGMLGMQQGLLKPSAPAVPSAQAQTPAPTQAAVGPFPPLKAAPAVTKGFVRPLVPGQVGYGEKQQEQVQKGQEFEFNQEKDQRTRLNDAVKQLSNENAAYKNAQLELAEVTRVKDLVKESTTNPTAAKALAGYLANYANGERRLNPAIMEAMGEPSAKGLDRIKQAYMEMRHGTLPPKLAGFVQKFLDTTAASNRKISIREESKALKQFAQQNDGWEPEALIPTISAMPDESINQNPKLGPIGAKIIKNPRTGGYILSEGANAAK